MRVRTALCDLEMLAEGRAMSWNPAGPISGPKASSHSPTGEAPTIDRHIGALEAWCKSVEEALKREQIGERIPDSRQQIEYRVSHEHAGKRIETVMEAEGLSYQMVAKIRTAAKQDVARGNPLRNPEKSSRQREAA